jgi:hypothetical protein
MHSVEGEENTCRGQQSIIFSETGMTRHEYGVEGIGFGTAYRPRDDKLEIEIKKGDRRAR